MKKETKNDSLFNANYAIGYEELSVKEGNYLRFAKWLISFAGKKSDNITIVDLGSGTGNSTIELGEAYPNAKIISIEPNSVRELANYKFGISGFPDVGDTSIPLIVKNYIEAQKTRALKIKDRVTLLSGSSQSIPQKDNAVDLMFGVQSFHWFMFETNDAKGENRDYLDVSLREIARVLKPDAKYYFDSTGLQFDFQDDTNKLHFMNHPFHLAFIDNFNKILLANHFPKEALLNKEKIDKYQHIFDWNFLKSKMEKFGLEPLILPNGEKYHKEIIPKTAEDLKTAITKGGNMRYFHNSLLKTLSEDSKTKLLNSAMKKTLEINSDLLSKPAAEIWLAFAFQKTK